MVDATKALIPVPKHVESVDGQFNIVWPMTIGGHHPEATGMVDSFIEQFEQWALEPCFQFETGPADSSMIKLVVDEKLVSEAYAIQVNVRCVLISASSAAGWFYGLQTLAQMLRRCVVAGAAAMDCVTIHDSPRFAWRGLHLDVCRHFFEIPFVKRLLDLMAIHKLNRFHWHLTEDQGWRLDVPPFPKLAEISAWREGDGGRAGESGGKPDAASYGGFYTREDVAEVVAYAADRCIQVVPEIELPGHSIAALAAYPDLACQPRAFKVETEWGIFDDVYCAGNESTFSFLQSVMDYVIEVFPGDVVHIGGDECPKTRWKACPKCQDRMAAEGLKNEDELQSWFVQRMVNYLAERGKRAIGWDEILEGGLAEGAMVMSWRGYDGGVAAARMGHDVVMSPTSHCYFDYRQADDEEEMGFHGVNTLRDVYDFQPVPAELTEDEARHVLGGQANVWTERQLYKTENVEYMLVPRICALAEVVWGHAPAGADWDGFRKRLGPHVALLSELGYRGRPLDE